MPRLFGVVAIIVSVLFPTAVRSADPPPVVRRVLPNGLVVLVREHHAARVVAVSLMTRAETVAETERTAGTTNFLQRVMIRGTRALNATRVAEAAEDLGGRIDASGDVDIAEVQAQALARHWEKLLTLVANVALTPALASEQIEQERRLIVSQIQMRADTPFTLAMETLTADLYGAHPYALPVAGSQSSIQGITRDMLVARYQQLFRADRLVLAVSGDIKADRVVNRVERLFGALPRSELASQTSPPAPSPRHDRRLVEHPAQQAQIVVGYLAPSVNEPDYPAVKVLSAVLGGGTGGRLFVELRERRGLAYSLGVLNASRAGPAAIVVYMRTSPRSLDDAETGLTREIEQMKDAPPGADELVRAKAYVLGTLAMDRRTNARQAWYLAFFEALGAGWDFPERYAQRIEGVTAADVQAAATKYLNRPTIVVLRPPR